MPVAPIIKTERDAALAQKKIDSMRKLGNLNAPDEKWIAETETRIRRFRTSDEPDAPRFLIDPGHPVISELIERQGKVGNSPFAKRHLSISATVWLRVKNGTYQATDHTAVWQKLKSDLAILKESEELRKSDDGTILDFSHVKAMLAAIRTAQKEERDRFIAFLADTGGGKSVLAERICAAFPNSTVRVEATEPWRRSYYAPIAAISKEVGMKYIHRHAAGAETELLANLAERPRIIIIDEAVYFSATTLNLLKAIMNHTDCVVVALALPVFWRRMESASWEEAKQVINRTAAKITVERLALPDIRLAANTALPNWATLGTEQTPAEKLLQAAANSFGLWNTVYPVLRELAKHGPQNDLTLDQVEQAISDLQTLRR